MKNLRKVFVFLTMVLVFAFCAFAQDTSPKNADIVIMVDTSGGILQYYEEINSRVLSEISKHFIRKGDTVHVLSFNSSARYEISQKINTEKDFSRVVSRFLLLYQIGQNSDFLTGLDFCKKYTERLPKKDEQILIVISDGIFNPPAWSPYKNYSGQQVKNEISHLAGNIRKSGWKVYYVKLPYPSDAIIKNLEGEEFYSGTDGNLQKIAKGSSSDDSKSGTDGSSGKDGSSGARDSSGDSSGGTDGSSGNDGNSGDTDTSSGGDNGTTDNNDEDSSSGDSGYTDVSGSFTESSGAAKSDLTKDKEFELNKNLKYFPIVTYPDSIEAHGKKLKFSVKISNKTDEVAELQLEKIILDNGLKSEKIAVRAKTIIINPGEEAVLDISAKLPSSYKEGRYTCLLGLEFADSKKVFPQFAELNLAVFPTAMQKIFGSNLLFLILGLLALLLLILLIVFLVRRNSGSTSGAISNAGTVKRSDTLGSSVSSFGAYNEDEKRQPRKLDDEADHAKRLSEFNTASSLPIDGRGSGYGSTKYSSENLSKIEAQKKADDALSAKILKGSLAFQQPRGSYMSPANHLEKIEIKANKSGMSEIFVLNQSRNIGKRNIHVMKAGTRLSVGGGKTDDFLIFLVPFPSKLAQVRYDGKDYHLAILKPEYFPYEKSNVVNNCIGKTIAAVSDKGYHVYFTFRDYEDPATKLNNLLTSIQYD